MQGRVKTRGRLASDGKVITGKDIPNATITLGDGSTFKSGSNGRFSFAVTKGNYYLKNVQKRDYQLCDRDLLGRTKKYSANVLEIAMQTPDEALEDRLESEEKIRATLNRQLSKQKAELKRMKEELKISQQEYNKKLQELYAAQSNNEKLISEMAERYSTIDFDQMDDFQRRVAAFIQNGELTRADSLLKTKGSMEERSAELDRLHTANVEKREILERSESMEATLLEDFAADCYSYYEMCKLQHKNDSAAYWLELRASKDTTNVEWQSQLGSFVEKYLADYNKALDCYQLALRITLEQYGEEHPDVATTYNNIGTIFAHQGEYAQALEYYSKSLDIKKKIFGKEHPILVKSYNNIGTVYNTYGAYDRALEYHTKALEIQKKIFGEEHPDVATIYNNIGLVYHNLHNVVKACEYYNIALEIWIKAFGEYHPVVATIYNNIGSVYSSQGDYVNALECLSKALEIQKKMFGEEHPDVATSYDNIGSVYSSKGDYTKAQECYSKALEIRKKTFGEEHPDVASSYNNIGYINGSQGDYAKALEYLNKALEIQKTILGENHSQVLGLWTSIAVVYEEARQNNVVLAEYEDFVSNMVSTATTVGDGTPAKQAGWDGEYVVFEFGDWNVSMASSIMQKNEELRGKPKTVVVMKDGTILQHHFENSIGVQLGVKYVGKQEKKRIIQQYLDWKKK